MPRNRPKAVKKPKHAAIARIAGIFNSTPSRLLWRTLSVYYIFGEVAPGGYKVSFKREKVVSDCRNALDGVTGAIGLATY